MAVHKHGKYYRMVFMHKGRRFQKSTKCTARRDAEEVERAFRTQLAKGDYGFEESLPTPRFSVAMREFLAWRDAEHSSADNTIRRGRTASRALSRYFGNLEIDRITIETVENFKQWRKVQTKLAPNRKIRKLGRDVQTHKVIKPATVNRELACLRAMINYYIKRGVLIRNPVSSVKFLKEGNEQNRVLSLEEERLYLLACSQPLQDVAAIMIDTGMRPSEVYKLQRGHVNLEKATVFVDEGKTASARRKIPLTDRALSVLERRVRDCNGDYLFPAMRGGSNSHIVKLNNAHKSAVARAKLERFRIYDLRHTFATRAAEAGVDLVTLAALLGHSRVQMLMRYAHPTEQHQVEAIRRIEMLRKKAAAIAYSKERV